MEKLVPDVTHLLPLCSKHNDSRSIKAPKQSFFSEMSSAEEVTLFTFDYNNIPRVFHLPALPFPVVLAVLAQKSHSLWSTSSPA